MSRNFRAPLDREAARERRRGCNRGGGNEELGSGADKRGDNKLMRGGPESSVRGAAEEAAGVAQGGRAGRERAEESSGKDVWRERST